MTKLNGAAATDVGRVRQMNEDRYLVGEGLYAVADGVGGHQAGEVAAQTAVEALAEHFTERTPQGLVEAVLEANNAVWTLAQENAERRGMGTTITAVALVEEDGDDQLAVANVGDSRAYLFQRGDLVQITEDHSLVEELVREGQLTPEEAQVHPQRSIITRALGMEPDIEVDIWPVTPYAGDRILLCSDGLTNEISADRIAATLRQLSDPQEAARDLVRQARAHGGNDNITVVVVDVVDDGGRAQTASRKLGREPKGTRTVPSTDPTAAWSPSGGTDRDGRTGPPGAPGAPSQASTATATRTRAPAGRTVPPQPPELRPKRFTWRVCVFFLVFLGVLGVVAGSLAWYGRSAYFVGVTADNQVAIFRGRPGGFLWFQPTLDKTVGLSIDEVPEAYRAGVIAGKEEPSRADADRYVNNLRPTTTTTTTTTAPPTTTAPSTTTIPRPPPT